MMNLSMLEIRENLFTGNSVIPLLAPVLKKQLDDFFSQQEILIKEAPLFLKTMVYYKLISQENLRVLTLTPFDSSALVQTLQKHGGIIQPGIYVEDLINIPNDEFLIKNIDSINALDLKIAATKKSTFRGASHPFFMGLLFLNFDNLADDREIAISIVHELAHQELFLLNMFDRLVTSSLNPRLIHSPYQDRVRPSIGRLHSAHALYRMLQVEKDLHPVLAEKHRNYLKNTIATFEDGELTELGSFLLEIYGKEA